MADDEKIENNVETFDEDNSNVEEKAKKSGFGFFGWLIVFVLVVIAIIGLALPRFDQNLAITQKLTNFPVIGKFFGAGDIDTSTQNDSSDTVSADQDAQESTETAIGADEGTKDEAIEVADADQNNDQADNSADPNTEILSTNDADATASADANANQADASSETNGEIASTNDADAATSSDANMDAQESTDELTSGDSVAQSGEDSANATADNQALLDEIESLKAQLAEANELGNQASSNANKAAKATAISTLGAAVLVGTSIDEGVEALKSANVEVPAALQGEMSEIPSAIELENDFGSYAISAIRASKAVGGDDGVFSGLRVRLASEFASRSLTPQEGMTPDAVLSRAEDALRRGDLEASLSEISVLPSEAQEAMAPWVEKANQRLDVLSAINELAQSVISE